MTASDLSLLKAEIALLRSVSTTKGPAQRYGAAAIRDAIAGAGERLAETAPPKGRTVTMELTDRLRRKLTGLIAAP